jgi:hypothetical protein
MCVLMVARDIWDHGSQVHVLFHIKRVMVRMVIRLLKHANGVNICADSFQGYPGLQHPDPFLSPYQERDSQNGYEPTEAYQGVNVCADGCQSYLVPQHPGPCPRPCEESYIQHGYRPAQHADHAVASQPNI